MVDDAATVVVRIWIRSTTIRIWFLVGAGQPDDSHLTRGSHVLSWLEHHNCSDTRDMLMSASQVPLAHPSSPSFHTLSAPSTKGAFHTQQ